MIFITPKVGHCVIVIFPVGLVKSLYRVHLAHSLVPQLQVKVIECCYIERQSIALLDFVNIAVTQQGRRFVNSGFILITT